MEIPLVDLACHHGPIRAEILSAIERVVDSSEYILGSCVHEFEQQIAGYCGVKHAIGVSSGTDALLVALMAHGIGIGDEVITTCYSFVATAECIARVGAKPVFVDIDPLTHCINPCQIEDSITKRTKAVIAVHMYGQCSGMSAIMTIAHRYGLVVIEDAAQAIGAQYRDGRCAGSIGTCGCFSFFPSKNLGAIGDGGMVVTNDDKLAERVLALRSHGGVRKNQHDIIGGNFRLDAIQAAVLSVKLQYLDGWTFARQERANLYKESFETAFLHESCSLPNAVYEESGVPRYHVYNQFVIQVNERDELRRYLFRRGINTAVYYPRPLHLQKCFGYLGYRKGHLPAAELAGEHTLALPMSPGLRAEELRYVTDMIAQWHLQAGVK